jgi:hypothetical protein
MKSVTERIFEVKQVYQKLKELGLNDQYEGIHDFKQIANLFVREGVPASGKIKLPEIDRILEYILSNNIPSTVMLKKSKH